MSETTTEKTYVFPESGSSNAMCSGMMSMIGGDEGTVQTGCKKGC